MKVRSLAVASSLAALLASGCGLITEEDDDDASEESDEHGADDDDGAPAKVRIDRSALGDVGTEPGLDYADPRYWLCRPGNDPNECDRDLDATELLANGKRADAPHVKAKKPEFDCFYVYPTVKLTSAGPMTDFANINITLDPLLSQGARFSELCTPYAPLYRQTGVVPAADGAPTGVMTTPGGSPVRATLGVDDVRDAFRYYLEHLNKGRKFVLIGHSQGTGMLTELVKRDIDEVKAVRDKMLSALLIGGSIAVPEGRDVGGTFKNVPLCTKAGQTGCVITYVSYSAEQPPAATSTFGRSPGAGLHAGCTEPATLAGRAGKPYARTYLALKRINPGFQADGFELLPKDIETPYLLYRDVFRGTCKTNDAGFSWLEIALDMDDDDPRPPPPYRNARTEAALGLHVMDYNLELGDLIEAVRLQAKAARH